MVLKQTEILAAKKLTAGQTGLKVVKLPTRGEKMLMTLEQCSQRLWRRPYAASAMAQS